MRIGIDYRPALGGFGGIAVYVRELVDALALLTPSDELELFGHRLRRPASGALAPVPASARLHRKPLPAPLLSLAGSAGLGADRLLGDVDVLHATDFAPLASTRAPLVVTVHDVCFQTLSGCYPKALRDRLAARTVDLVGRARLVIVPCARVASELTAWLPEVDGRVRVVPHGPQQLPAAEPPAESGRYVLAVGTLQPRKNFERLLDAFAALHTRLPDVRLIVAGARGWDDTKLVQRLGTTPGVSYVGAVEPDRLAGLYAGAAALAYPSLGEGFGLPALEGMARGLPTLVGADTAASDLAADGAVAVDPRDVGALADGLARLLEDAALREQLGDAGPARAAKFTWARTALLTRAVYVEAAAS